MEANATGFHILMFSVNSLLTALGMRSLAAVHGIVEESRGATR